ncbi:TIGR03668 family PPOX class F420-dependent oxidoreductase [Catellatospora paridis]|uniref:TIGR03668 family PPOX class F420-dependent oxidoreductase n=1 Tax=Catellatospora paridis TaxID=1617086 RepID=UPI001E3C92E0|nr:TIGR03668 family PPOX class F420-dependent oxidoreductase [Catellatospora paridis]
MSTDRERFATARVARLATVGPSGAPHLVPVVFALAGDTVYSAVDRKPKRTLALRRLANVAADPRVCLLADHYEDDWSALWWVRADGTARVLAADDPEAATALRLLTDRYPQYVTQPPPGPVLAVDVAQWTGWTAAGR